MSSSLVYDEFLNNDLRYLLEHLINDERVNINITFKAQDVLNKFENGLIQCFRKMDNYELADLESKDQINQTRRLM